MYSPAAVQYRATARSDGGSSVLPAPLFSATLRSGGDSAVPVLDRRSSIMAAVEIRTSEGADCGVCPLLAAVQRSSDKAAAALVGQKLHQAQIAAQATTITILVVN